MPTQFAAADPAIKDTILRGVFEQNKAMTDARSRPEAARRRRPGTPSIAHGKSRWYALASAVLVWVLLGLAPANTPFLGRSALPGAATPEPTQARPMGPLATTADVIRTTAPRRPDQTPLGHSGPDVIGPPPAHAPWSQALGVGWDPAGSEALWVSSALQPEPVAGGIDPDPVIDGYLNSPMVEPRSYVSLLDGTELPITTLFGLKVRTLMIDPGHGGTDPGAIGMAGTREKDVTLDIALRLQRQLGRHPQYRVLLTRDRDRSMSLKERVTYAARQKADLFVSIHVNSLPQRPVNLVETYFFGPSADARAVALAEQENQGSDYAVADFHSLIQKIGDTLKTQESRELAADVQAALVGGLRQQDGDITDAGIKTAPFVVLLGVDVPSVLTEVSCISNTAEESRLATEEHRRVIATSIKRGIIRYLQEKSNNGLITGGELSDGAKEDQNG
jgi:N-acetylmuramoyl-L-alanine amidase